MSTALVLFGPSHAPATARSRLAEVAGSTAETLTGGWGWAVRAVTTDAPATVTSTLSHLAAQLGCDHAVISGELATRLPRLVVMDVDSTVTTTEAIDLLADEAGAGEQVAAITDQAMRGELDFTASLQARVGTLTGLTREQVERARDRVALQPGALEWGRWAAEHQLPLALLSGGFTSFVEPVATAIGARFHRANTLQTDPSGTLTGRVTGEVIDRAAKARHLRSLADDLGISTEQVMAVGDGANDLDMLAAAGLGVAYCAKPVTAARADVAITFARLDALIALLAPTSSPSGG